MEEQKGSGGASAPSSTEYTHFESDKLTFVHPDLQSFDDFQNKAEPWIKEPDHPEDLYRAVRDEEWCAGQSWILGPNAETQDALLCAVNNSERSAAFTNNGTMGTQVRPGEVLFCTNRNKQLVYGQGMHQFFMSMTKKDGGVVNLDSQKFVQKGNITIVTLHPNEVAIALKNRQPVLLLPGRHAFHDPEFSIRPEDIFELTDDCLIRKHGITIVLVPAGQIGFAQIAGGEILMKTGLHVSRSPSFVFERNISTRTLRDVAGDNDWKGAGGDNGGQGEFVMHDNIAIVRVAQSQYGCAFVNGEPVFLTPGLHVYNNPSFAFTVNVKQTDSIVKFENLHIVQVQPNQIGLAWEGNRPILMGPGIWHKSSPRFRFEMFRLSTDQVIEHGSITRYQVKHGELGFAWQDGQVMELQPGIELVDDPNFKFNQTFKLSQEVIQFGNIAHVTTREGHCRPVYVDGKLQILRAGYKKFTQPNLIVGDCFPTSECILSLSQIEVLTRDRTPMLVTGQVTYQISTPEDLILNLGFNNLRSGLERTTDAILRHAFSITDLSTISPDSHTAAQRAEAEHKAHPEPFPAFRREHEDEEGQSFQSALCYSVKKELGSSTSSWGLIIKDVAISDIQFKDREVASKLADATSNTRTAEAEFDLTLAKNKIRLETAQAEAKEQEIMQTNTAKLRRIEIESAAELRLLEEKAKADADAMTKLKLVETESKTLTARADASATTVKIEAETEANKIVALAKARRDAALMEAEGQKALADAQISRFNDPQAVLQLEMMKLWVEGAKALAQTPQPAVLLQSGGGGDDNGLLNVFRNQGKALLAAAMQKDKIVRGAQGRS